MSDIVNKNENLELELEDNTILSNLFGINDRNLSLIEQINQVKINLYFCLISRVLNTIDAFINDSNSTFKVNTIL